MNDKENALASHLIEIGFSKFFQSGNRNLADSIWQDGKTKDALLDIVSKKQYDPYARLLASEILFLKYKNYPNKELQEFLAYIYAKALWITGNSENSKLSGNLWGFMFFSDKNKIPDYGPLGTRLVKTGQSSIPYLKKLLNNDNFLLYEGSQEATIGNGLKYRVKDAAAYYIGKIAGIPVQFHEDLADRDAEIDRLKEKLK